MTVVLVIEYDGTDFHGFANQQGVRTVAGTLWEKIARIEGPNVEIFGAGRTDAGAHAVGQTVHFVAGKPIEAGDWRRILNRCLPPDIRVRSARRAPESFHARFSAASREYRYSFLNRPADSVFLGRYAVHEPRRLDVEAMNDAAASLVGEHDFRAFTQEPEGFRHSVRTLFRAEVRRAEPHVRFGVEGTAFLRGMVRMMSGALWEIGLGKRDVSEIARLLVDPKAAKAPPVLPAHGLCLMRVRYKAPASRGEEETDDDANILGQAE